MRLARVSSRLESEGRKSFWSETNFKTFSLYWFVLESQGLLVLLLDFAFPSCYYLARHAPPAIAGLSRLRVADCPDDTRGFVGCCCDARIWRNERERNRPSPLGLGAWFEFTIANKIARGPDK